MLFAKMAEKRNVTDLIMNVGADSSSSSSSSSASSSSHHCVRLSISLFYHFEILSIRI
jgi:hypothetical protein